MAMAEVKQLKTKLNAVNRALVKLEMDSIYMDEKEEQRRYLLAELEAWKLTKEDLKTELYNGLLSHCSVTYATLDALEQFLIRNLDLRFEKLALRITDPEDIIGEFIANENLANPETEEIIEGVQDSELMKRILEKIVVTSKALVGEIRQELDNSERKNLEQWLKDTEKNTSPYIPYEWYNLDKVRNRVRHTGIELSKLLVRFMSSLAGNVGMLRKLDSSIRSLTTVPKKCVVGEKFVDVMAIASVVFSDMKLKGELVESRIEEEQLWNHLITQFFEAILHLDSVISTATVPETRGMVAGARIRLEDLLGQVLYIMQGIKLRVPKQRNKSWKTLKVMIADLWKEKKDEGGSVPGIEEIDEAAAGGSVTEQGEASSSRVE